MRRPDFALLALLLTAPCLAPASAHPPGSITDAALPAPLVRGERGPLPLSPHASAGAPVCMLDPCYPTTWVVVSIESAWPGDACTDTRVWVDCRAATVTAAATPTLAPPCSSWVECTIALCDAGAGTCELFRGEGCAWVPVDIAGAPTGPPIAELPASAYAAGTTIVVFG